MPAARIHEHFMDLALLEAKKAKALNEVPIGAILVDVEGNIIGRGHNQPIASADPSAHAEIVALREAARSTGNYRLYGATLYCTKEPCVMCAGAIVHARIALLVLGAPDPKSGAAGSLYNVVADPRLNHSVEVIRGIRDVESMDLLQQFFKARR
jgi:tRNA(adenine34) deaminase